MSQRRKLPTILERSRQGATLALVVALCAIVIVIGIVVWHLCGLLGGFRELKTATDSGSLNVGKEAIKHPTVTLSQGVENDNYGGLTDPDGNINLLNYNRLTAQTLIVSANAQVEGTTQAKQNFQTLISAFQSDGGSVSKRLHDALATADQSNKYFTSLARSNSTRMLSNATVKTVDSGFTTAYVDKASPTNIALDPSILPTGVKLPADALSNAKASNGKPYINGYVDIAVGTLPAIAGASVHPQQQPHLVSKVDFKASVDKPVSVGAVPPNSFQCGTKAADRNSNLIDFSCSTVGALAQEYQASIPRGYIVISNPAGFNFGGSLPNPNSIYNNQLYTGLFLANNGAFSTNEDSVQAWVDYNNRSQKAGTTPSLAGIFNANGDPLTLAEAQRITSMGGGANNYPIEVDYTMTSGQGAIPAVAALVPAMEKAYDAQNGQAANSVELTAVEELKGMVMTMFANKETGNVPAPKGTSGLRLFDHQKAYPVAAGAPPLISESGNVIQLLDQVGDSTILPQLKQRMREIKPTATDSEMMKLLQSKLVGLGDTLYIWQDPTTDALTIDQHPPSWVASLPKEWQDGTNADGNPVDSSTIFPTIGYSVDPKGEAGFNNVLYDVTSDPSSTGLATDAALWTPSSGFNNLLGVLRFNESIKGVAAASNPPPTTPTPPPTMSCASCTPKGCSYPWDAAAANLGPNATMADAANLLKSYGASSMFQYSHPNVANGVDGMFANALNSNWQWNAAMACYLGSSPFGAINHAAGTHTYSGTDFSGIAAFYQNVPGQGQGFIKWFDAQNCGSALVIMENLN